jgi:biotin operon repressor
MSSKTRHRNRNVRTAVTTDRARRGLRAVRDSTTAPPAVMTARTDAEDKLWKALHANPNSTTADLSTHAGIGKSTAGKILAHWATDGSVTRTPGIAEGGRRAADLWSINDTGHATSATTAAATSTEHSAETTDPDPIPTGTTPSVIGQVNDSQSPDDPPQDANRATTGLNAGGSDAASKGGGPPLKVRRLPPGGLRGLVEDWLRDHPGEQFSPNAIGKELGRSSGAVHNALEKLVVDGYAIKASEKPKRYTLAPREKEASKT